jgi:hypothetical protein
MSLFAQESNFWFFPNLLYVGLPWSKVVFRGSFGILFNPPGVPYFNGVPDGFAPGFKGTNQASSAFSWDSDYPGVFQPGKKNADPQFLFPVVTVDPAGIARGI